MKQNERIKIFNSDKNLVLEFNPIIPDDMGEYECKVVKKGENPSAIAPEKTLAIEIKGNSCNIPHSYLFFLLMKDVRDKIWEIIPFGCRGSKFVLYFIFVSRIEW